MMWPTPHALEIPAAMYESRKTCGGTSVSQSICYGSAPERKSSLCWESQISFQQDKCKHLVAVLGLSVLHPPQGA